MLRKIHPLATHWYLMVKARSAALPSTERGAPQAGRLVPAEWAPEMTRVVRGLAGQLHARLPHGCGIEMSDLIQAGNVGLLQAARSFEPEKGAPLCGYAKFRIRGEMLDMVRRHASRPRGSRLPALTEDGADLEVILFAPAESSPHSSMTTRQRAAIIGEELLRLPARYRSVVRMRYGREMTLRQIASKLKVNESRACQLHRIALTRLRKALCSRGVRQLAHL